MDKKSKIGRRDVIKGLATVPVVGALAYAWYKKRKLENLVKKSMQDEVSLNRVNPVMERKVSADPLIRLGIIGVGGRASYLLKAAGFLHPETIDSWIEEASKNKSDKRYEEFLEQDDLNIVVNGVCDHGSIIIVFVLSK